MIRMHSGAVNGALNPLLEAVQQADEARDKALRVSVRYGLCLAHWYSGRFRESLASVNEGLNLAQEDLDIGADRLGFSPYLGYSMLRGLALSLMGDPRKGVAELDRLIELARVSQQFVPLWVSHTFHVYCCEVTGDAAAALGHARDAVDYAERASSSQGRIAAYSGLGVANVLNLAWHDALDVLEQALAIGRDRQLLAMEGRLLTGMAAAHLGLGDRARALSLVEESIALGRRWGKRSWEILALLMRIRILRETHGAQATTEIESTMTEADAWLEMSGARATSRSSASSAPSLPN
jgi:tetratricopeptide (TPR) repeat protein